MNGAIEDFNGEFGDKLWGRGRFRDLEHLRREAKIFLERHNNRQDWKCRMINREAIPQRRISEYFEVDTNNLSLTEGKVHFIRQVKENGTISVLNWDFSIDKSLAHEYVWATVDTKHEQLMIYYRAKNAEAAGLVKVHEYKIDEDVMEFEVMF